MKSLQGGSPDHKENPLEKEEHVTDLASTRMRVEFPQWEDGDLTGLLSHAERYFRYQWTLKAFMNLEHEENTEEDLQPANCMVHALAGYANPHTIKNGGFLRQQPITILVDTGSTSNFMDSKVTTQMMLQIDDCSRFDVKVADGRILKCDRKCSRVKLVLQGQEITADFFLLPLENNEAVLSIECCLR
ncbi:hypothetical protein B296_00028309 [Ensete ventricosum]|uniref:Aspartic peptidase DDI1-type domain-containing protein n=1 Tax=Ensete ventricosum TaxID=4639 RepID=A0A426ZJ32_ENSVE|nr:hypothetical protein B296_00028309 [Ensete ventricosum]